MFLNRQRLKKLTKIFVGILVVLLALSLVITMIPKLPTGLSGINENIHGNVSNTEEIDKKAIEDRISMLESELESNPGDVDILLQIASLYTYIGENEKAIDTYKKAAEAQPDNVEALTVLANFYIINFEYDLAEQYVKQILDKQPENLNALYLYSLILAEGKEDYKLAIENMEKVLDMLSNEDDKERINEIIEQWQLEIKE